MRNTFLIVKLTLFLFVASFAIACNGQAKSESNYPEVKTLEKTKAEKIDELIQLYVGNAGFNGSVLVAHQGKVVYKKGFGYANMEWQIPNQVDSKYRIASITKPFTAMLIMKLVEEKKLDLHEPITTYLKDYPKATGDLITIHHLLTHSAGLTRDFKIDDKKYHRPQELVEVFINEPLVFTPGEKFDYSNSGYVLLGYLLETVSEKSYKELLEEKIFIPLKMKNSGYHRHRDILTNRASGYTNNFIDYRNSNYLDFANVYSAGAIYSTVEDMYLFDQALYGETLLSRKYLDLCFIKHMEDVDYGGYYGYGWEVIEKPIGNTKDKVNTFSHGGSLPGFCSTFTRIPSSRSTIVLLNNTGRAWLNAITTAVTAILYDQPYDLPKISVAKSLYDIVNEKGIAEGKTWYNQVKDNEGYFFDEEDLNIVSYQYLRSGQAEIAVEILQLALVSFPEAFNLYDSLGEVLLSLDRKEEAIKNYKKSIELNPKNQNGIKVLKDLGIE